MKSFFNIGRLFKIFAFIGIGCGVGFYFGSALPSPGYISYLSNMPLHMNSPTDVSDHVESYLPADPIQAFDLVAAASRSVWSSYDADCTCTYFFFKRMVRVFPIPDRELTVVFVSENGDIRYHGASIVIWFL